MRKVKSVLALLCCIVTVFPLMACKYKGYEGDHPDLYSVAINSLLKAYGSYTHEIHEDPQIKILDKDEHGRILFAYSEFSNISTLSLLIMQRRDSNYAYFYSDYNFIATDADFQGYLNKESFEKALSNAFSNEEIDSLKSLNDWSENVIEEKCVKVKIVRKKLSPEIDVNEYQFEILFYTVAKARGYKGDDKLFRFISYCTTDNYGRTLYYAYGVGRDADGTGIRPNSTTMEFNLILIFNSDGTFNKETCVAELLDLYNYQNQLSEFKEMNNWNNP